MFAVFNFLLYINDGFANNWSNFVELQLELKNGCPEIFLKKFLKFLEHLLFRAVASKYFLLQFMKSSGYLKYYGFQIVLLENTSKQQLCAFQCFLTQMKHLSITACLRKYGFRSIMNLTSVLIRSRLFSFRYPLPARIPNL